MSVAKYVLSKGLDETVKPDVVDLSGWKPIESAPKDGTKIVLGGPTWVDVGSWDDWYDQSAPGWFSETNHNGYISAGLDPTHWMPLPSPPGSET